LQKKESKLELVSNYNNTMDNNCSVLKLNNIPPSLDLLQSEILYSLALINQAFTSVALGAHFPKIVQLESEENKISQGIFRKTIATFDTNNYTINFIPKATESKIPSYLSSLLSPRDFS
jgi:hypothetical protein